MTRSDAPAVDPRAGSYAHPFPTGWYRIAGSRTVARGSAHRVDALGESFVVWRGDSGQVYVAEGYCPHQGAHLAGGRVDGEGVRCPFHDWRFAGDGALDAIPGLERLPRARLCTRPVHESHGTIWMWHDAAGGRRPAAYPFDPVDPIAARGMRFCGEYDAGVARMHIREFAENSVDFQHFAHVHGAFTVPWTTLTLPLLRLQHKPRWWVDADRPHVACFEDESWTTLRGRVLESTRSVVQVTLFGPGGVNWFHFKIPSVGELLLFQTHLPHGPLEQRVTFRWYADPGISKALAWIIVGQWVANWKADLPLWENKRFVDRPVLVSLDGPVRQLRKWYAQFLPPEDPPRARRPSLAAK